MVEFTNNKEEKELIRKIVKRVMDICKREELTYDKLDCMMDIDATHMNGCPLDLNKLLKTDESTFIHDVFGIRNHINRRTGKLINFFLPRCSK